MKNKNKKKSVNLSKTEKEAFLKKSQDSKLVGILYKYSAEVLGFNLSDLDKEPLEKAFKKFSKKFEEIENSITARSEKKVEESSKIVYHLVNSIFKEFGNPEYRLVIKADIILIEMLRDLKFLYVFYLFENENMRKSEIEKLLTISEEDSSKIRNLWIEEFTDDYLEIYETNLKKYKEKLDKDERIQQKKKEIKNYVETTLEKNGEIIKKERSYYN